MGSEVVFHVRRAGLPGKAATAVLKHNQPCDNALSVSM
jgi:hypothetical protein